MPRPLVLPAKKNLLSYARALTRAENPLQLALLEENYEKHLAGDAGALEVLGLLKLWVGAALASCAGSKCVSCQGSRFEASMDNDGGYYMGCPSCTIVIPPELLEMFNAERKPRAAAADRGAAFAPVRVVRRKLRAARTEPLQPPAQPRGAARLLPPGKRDD